MKQNWRKFYFDGNTAWGQCDTPEDWDKIRKLYAEHSPEADPLKAMSADDTENPVFGFAKMEGKTLREFIGATPG